MSDADPTVVRRLLPTSMPRVDGYDVAGGTSAEGDGDTIWDCISLATGGWALVCLRVGGAPELRVYALGVTRALLRATARYAVDLDGLLQATNEALAAAAVSGAQPAVQAGLLAPLDGFVEWASAGRVPGGIIRRTGGVEAFSAHAPPLGMMGGFNYRSERFDMAVGDAAFAVSHASPGLFRGVVDLLAKLGERPAGEVVSSLQKAIHDAAGDRPGDTTVLYARRA